MKGCLRIPRIYLALEAADWAIPLSAGGGERSPEIGDIGPRALLLPPAQFCSEDAELAEAVRKNMYGVLEEGAMRRLERGFVLVERTVRGTVRRGILACVDLEECTFGSKSMVRATMECDERIARGFGALRENALLEFPHTVLCYRDKRDKLMRWLRDEEWQPLYDFALPDGGRLCGQLMPAYAAEDVLHMLVSKADPAFGVLDGHNYLLAARRYWESLKPTLSAQEARNHPARFTLAEFVNLCDDGVRIEGAEKDEILSAIKTGKPLPHRAFSLVGERLLLEGREISYD